MSDNNKLLLAACAVVLLIFGGILLLNPNQISKTANLISKINPSQSLQQGQSQVSSPDNYNFTASQVPAFNFPSVAYASDLKKNTSVYNSKGEKIEAEISVVANGSGSSIQVNRPQQFTPGKYSLVINQNGKKIEQDFFWGVLAINTNKSIYAPGETAKLAIAVLDEKGNMVCDAVVILKIKNQISNIEEELSTKNGTIIVNPECSQKKYTVNPDYEAAYQVGSLGNYQMSLTAVTKKGTYNIVDFFTVENDIAFDVERITATRIFPYSIYPVLIKIIAKKDFSGEIVERVPTSFAITSLENTIAYNNIQTSEGIQYILWDVSLKKGETINIGYNFKAPLISPQFYLLGPLSLVTGNTAVFEEKRAWQLAIDALDYWTEVLADNPTVLLKMDEASGNLIDTQVGNDAVVSGTAMTYQVTGPAVGVSRAVNFASGTLATITDGTDVDLGDSNWSIEFWLKRNVTTNNQPVKKGNDVDAGGYECTWTNNLFRLQTGAGTNNIRMTVADTYLDWHHWVMTRGAGVDGTIWRDGVAVSSPSTTVTYSDTNLNLILGNDFVGSMAGFAVYKSQLSSTRVAAHYAARDVANAGNFRFEGLQMEGIKID